MYAQHSLGFWPLAAASTSASVIELPLATPASSDQCKIYHDTKEEVVEKTQETQRGESKELATDSAIRVRYTATGDPKTHGQPPISP